MCLQVGDAMNFFRQRLSLRDVERLMVNPSPQNKIEIVTRLVDTIPVVPQDSEEIRLAQDIIERLAGDVEVSVRQAVAWQLANCPVLTVDVARKLAADVASVAFPVLRYARLPDDVLVSAVGSGESRKIVAVAGREKLNEAVSDAVVDSRNVKAIVVLMGNEGAQISSAALNQVLDTYALIPAVTGAMAKRPDLTADIVLRLVAQVTEGVRDRLVKKYQIDFETVQKAVERGVDAALVLTLRPIGECVEQLEPFLRRLDELGALSAAFLFRALCAGEIQMFRLGLSIKGHLPLMAVDELLDDRGPLGLPALMKRCEIPLTLLPAYKAAVVAWRETHYQGQPDARAHFQSTVLSAVFESCLQIDDGEVEDLLQNVFTLTGAEAA